MQCRIVAGPVLTYYSVINPRTHWVIKLGAFGILLVSLLWFSKIVAMLGKVFSGKKEGGVAKKKK